MFVNNNHRPSASAGDSETGKEVIRSNHVLYSCNYRPVFCFIVCLPIRFGQWLLLSTTQFFLLYVPCCMIDEFTNKA